MYIKALPDSRWEVRRQACAYSCNSHSTLDIAHFRTMFGIMPTLCADFPFISLGSMLLHEVIVGRLKCALNCCPQLQKPISKIKPSAGVTSFLLRNPTSEAKHESARIFQVEQLDVLILSIRCSARSLGLWHVDALDSKLQPRIPATLSRQRVISL